MPQHLMDKQKSVTSLKKRGACSFKAVWAGIALLPFAMPPLPCKANILDDIGDGIQKLGTNIDPTNKNSTLREGLRKLDSNVLQPVGDAIKEGIDTGADVCRKVGWSTCINPNFTTVYGTIKIASNARVVTDADSCGALVQTLVTSGSKGAQAIALANGVPLPDEIINIAADSVKEYGMVSCEIVWKRAPDLSGHQVNAEGVVMPISGTAQRQSNGLPTNGQDGNQAGGGYSPEIERIRAESQNRLSDNNLAGIKDANSANLEGIKDTNLTRLEGIRDTNLTQLAGIKDTNASELAGTVNTNTTRLQGIRDTNSSLLAGLKDTNRTNITTTAIQAGTGILGSLFNMGSNGKDRQAQLQLARERMAHEERMLAMKLGRDNIILQPSNEQAYIKPMTHNQTNSNFPYGASGVQQNSIAPHTGSYYQQNVSSMNGSSSYLQQSQPSTNQQPSGVQVNASPGSMLSQLGLKIDQTCSLKGLIILLENATTVCAFPNQYFQAGRYMMVNGKLSKN